MRELRLIAVFWESNDDNSPKDAVVTVEDGVVVYIKSLDGIEVRLLWPELEKLFDFAVDEIDEQGGFGDEGVANYAVEDEHEVPF